MSIITTGAYIKKPLLKEMSQPLRAFAKLQLAKFQLASQYIILAVEVNTPSPQPITRT